MLNNYRYLKNYSYICGIDIQVAKIIRINKKSKVLAAKDDIMIQFAPDDFTCGHPAADSDLSRFFPPVDEACELAVLCRPGQFCASEIARAVEDCDAHLLNLNVMADRTADGDNVVALRVSRANGAPVARSLERYGYEVAGMRNGNTADADVVRERVNELIHYLEV